MTYILHSSFSPSRVEAIHLSPSHADYIETAYTGDQKGALASGDLKLRKRKTITGLADWQKNKVIRWIDDHIEENIRIEFLAAMVKLSVSRFSKAFKVSTGLAPYEYVLARRVEAAKYLILSTAEPLGQIAYACGLSDQAHLSKVFKRYSGLTPRRYRQTTTVTKISGYATTPWQRLAHAAA